MSRAIVLIQMKIEIIYNIELLLKKIKDLAMRFKPLLHVV